MEENLDKPLKEVLEIMQDRTRHSTYFGVKAVMSPIDHWVYQEIIFDMKPDVIIEIGNAFGGTTLSLAHMLDLIGRGRVIGIDVDHSRLHRYAKTHPRITFIERDACKCYQDVKMTISKYERVLVIEDSSHTYQNTLDILRTYSDLTQVGDYFIVEDGICHHGLSIGPYPGPYDAVETFISENKNFEIDRNKEYYFITWNPKGYLKRVN